MYSYTRFTSSAFVFRRFSKSSWHLSHKRRSVFSAPQTFIQAEKRLEYLLPWEKSHLENHRLSYSRKKVNVWGLCDLVYMLFSLGLALPPPWWKSCMSSSGEWLLNGLSKNNSNFSFLFFVKVTKKSNRAPLLSAIRPKYITTKSTRKMCLLSTTHQDTVSAPLWGHNYIYDCCWKRTTKDDRVSRIEV